MKHGIWSADEHDRFLLAIQEFPRGPWTCIASVIGTRSVRQVQTHTQKYYEKIMRRVRGLRKDRKTWARIEHRIDSDLVTFCTFMRNMGSSKVTPRDVHVLRVHSNLVVSPPSSTSSSPCTSPVATTDLDSSSRATWRRYTVPQTDLPPLDEALDFFIHLMDRESESARLDPVAYPPL
ncbi:hypothetical protein PsorP6_011489 [Peronosclerospora sorghi]|uniref:Uncharacterized protein n=1 Tax=Peronosclerospora sorghi TaxID=230839 RepID=A0ACC0WH99_9STRA|nr:hypothetical protein PsorP6_011489 [Peronosclerospora sorghi]